jgi:pSer/pThr/pTyr-binding forkhead associated (FHA) protein
MSKLVWYRTDGSTVDFPLEGESLLVGRGEEVDIRIDEPLVSREHARIERREAGFRVVDLGSTNRTRVNGDVVHQRFLSGGDEVRFARARCLFVEAETATAHVSEMTDEGR